MSSAKSKSTASKTMTKLEICSAFEKALPVGDSCILTTDTMVVVAFHLREEGVSKVVGSDKGGKHNVIEFAKPANWRGVQRVIDGELVDIGTPKGGQFTMYMSQYIGQA
jgi:hypothetical protein